MTRRDVLRCLNEPFADPCFFGPEACSQRYRVNGENPVADGFENCTFASRVSLIEEENATENVRLVEPTRHCSMQTLPSLLFPFALRPSI